MRKIGRVVREYLGVLIGVAVTAFGLTWFLIPGRIAAGGVSGLATVGYHLFGVGHHARFEHTSFCQRYCTGSGVRQNLYRHHCPVCALMFQRWAAFDFRSPADGGLRW